MHDRYDAELWNEHHDQFSLWVADALGGAGRALAGRIPALPAAAPQLAAVTAALSLTLLTFTASAA